MEHLLFSGLIYSNVPHLVKSQKSQTEESFRFWPDLSNCRDGWVLKSTPARLLSRNSESRLWAFISLLPHKVNVVLGYQYPDRWIVTLLLIWGLSRRGTYIFTLLRDTAWRAPPPGFGLLLIPRGHFNPPVFILTLLFIILRIHHARRYGSPSWWLLIW